MRFANWSRYASSNSSLTISEPLITVLAKFARILEPEQRFGNKCAGSDLRWQSACRRSTFVKHFRFKNRNVVTLMTCRRLDFGVTQVGITWDLARPAFSGVGTLVLRRCS
jgi:hypothetical protein